jgi:ribosome-binding ATPase YchF (GTP1/OBG family)
MLIGIVGKPSSGKSTFLNAACLTDAKTGNYPFTTIEPNLGSGSVKIECICTDMDVEDNPQNSLCLNGTRYIPVKLLDVPGLVPDAHLGKGLGNKFLSDLSRADVLLHIVDISGDLDQEGREIEDGHHDPMEDIEFLKKEIDQWFKNILLRQDWVKFTHKISMEKLNLLDALYKRLSGLSIKRQQIFKALQISQLDTERPDLWDEGEIEKFVMTLRKESKPIVIAANKIDKKRSFDNFNRLKNQLEEQIIPVSALSEFFLRSLAEKKIIDYYPGENYVKIIDEGSLNEKELSTLKTIEEKILKKYNNTGVQECINFAVFNVLKNIIVYPVHDEKKLSDKDGNVLPDAIIVPEDMELIDFVRDKIHSDLAKNFIYAIDAKTKLRLSEHHKLKNNDIIKIVSAAK